MGPFLDLSYHAPPLSDLMDATEAKTQAREATRSVREVEAQLERTLLVCEAMWSLMREKFGLTNVDLVRRVNEVDMTDGYLDGKVRRTPVSCPACHRTISPRSAKCMYCGQAVVHQPFA